MITVKVEMDIIATATMSYPDDSLENLVEWSITTVKSSLKGSGQSETQQPPW
jgi:hypothetical protein